jgi:hypothetical protein
MVKNLRAPDLSKKLRAAFHYAQENGWNAIHTKKLHVKFIKPGYESVFMSGTPGDWKVELATITKLRKAQTLEQKYRSKK